MPSVRSFRGLSTIAALVSVFGAAPARASDDGVRACVEAHAQGQVDRGSGQLLAARRQFLSCSQETCPLVVRKECVAFAEQIAAETPSIVLVATDSRGHEVPLASAAIDASWSLNHDFGMALELDPGSHEIVLRALDGRAAQKTFLLRAGEHLRRVVVEFPEPVPASPQEERPAAARGGVLPYVLGGVGLLALGSFVGFALDGKSQEHRLDECKPNCTREGVDRMRRSYLIADVSLAVALVAVGVDTYLVLKPPVSTQGAFGVSAMGRF
ncbi:MAG TPA: hypothetical protein VFQ35_15085 [Polyangiaceae bacterium]|nr:hypothetical protein [Polyangiaceae bacterium]